MENVWSFRYRPQKLQHLLHQPSVSQLLNSLAGFTNMPHILIHGAEGAGKSTRVNCLLQKIFSSEVYNIQFQERVLLGQEGTEPISYQIGFSRFHSELSVSGIKSHDAEIVQNVIKEIAHDGAQESDKQFRVLVLKQADRMSREAQAALRTTMETYVSSCRIILECTYPHKLINPIRSRCINIRLRTPSKESVRQILEQIQQKVKVITPEGILEAILNDSSMNLKKAILLLQTYHTHSTSTRPLDRLPENSKQVIVESVAKTIINNPTPQGYKHIEETLSNNLPQLTELKFLLMPLFNLLVESDPSPQFCMQLVQLCSKYSSLTSDAHRIEDMPAIMGFVADVMHLFRDIRGRKVGDNNLG